MKKGYLAKVVFKDAPNGDKCELVEMTLKVRAKNLKEAQDVMKKEANEVWPHWDYEIRESKSASL